MSLPRIDLADSTDEGRAIAEALRKRGYIVVERTVESLRDGSDAALVLLAGDDPLTIDALTALEERQASAPIILLGQPDDTLFRSERGWWRRGRGRSDSEASQAQTGAGRTGGNGENREVQI
jgi:hypothetical protein